MRFKKILGIAGIRQAAPVKARSLISDNTGKGFGGNGYFDGHPAFTETWFLGAPFEKFKVVMAPFQFRIEFQIAVFNGIDNELMEPHANTGQMTAGNLTGELYLISQTTD